MGHAQYFNVTNERGRGLDGKQIKSCPYSCIRDSDVRGGHIDVDSHPSMGHGGQSVHGLVQSLHSHSMGNLTRPNIGTLNPLVVLMATMGRRVAGHEMGDHTHFGGVVIPLCLGFWTCRTTCGRR